MSVQDVYLPGHSTTPGAFTNKRKEIINQGVRVIEDKYAQLAPTRAAKKNLSKLTSRDREAATKIPLETLATEWLSTFEVDLNVKKFLVDSLLPTLVIGLEKLLNEVTVRDLAGSTEEQEDFNPINYLAQFLMRNNPLYSRNNWDHAYSKAMRQTTDDIQKLLGSLENKKLEELRNKSKQRCHERELKAAKKMEEESKKVQQLKTSYSKWLGPGETAPPLSEMKPVLESWVSNCKDEVVKSEVEVFVASLSTSLLGQCWEEKEYVKSILKLELSVQPFQDLVGHMSLCGVERRRRFIQQKRREQIQAVFDHCTFVTNTSTVDRLRVVYLLTCFYDTQSPEQQQLFLNPREWPIMEVVELEELEEEEEHQRLSSGAAGSALSQNDIKEFLEEEVGEVGPGDRGEGTVDGEEEAGSVGGDTLPSSATKHGLTDTEEGPVSGDARGAEDNTTADGAKKADVPSREHGKRAVELSGKEKTMPSEDAEVESVATPTSLLEQRLHTTSSTRVKSLRRMRLVSGMMSRVILNPTGPGGSWDHEQLTRGQFVVLMEQFLGLEPEEATLNAVLQYVKEYYKETIEERRERLEQAKQMDQQLQHRRCVEELFQLWDSSLSGFIDLNDFVNTFVKWKGFEDENALTQAQTMLEGMGVEHGRMTRQQFCSYLHQVTAKMDHSHFLSLTDFLRTSIQITQEEERRSKLRRQWLNDMVKDSKTSDLKLSIALKNAVSIIHQDVVEFGGTKQISVVVSLLQKSPSKPEAADGADNEPQLRVNAASQSLQTDIIGTVLARDTKEGVSYEALDNGRPVHVTSIRAHGKVHYYVPGHNRDRYDGSLVVVPVRTPPGNSVGVVSIDSLQHTVPSRAITTGQTLPSAAGSAVNESVSATGSALEEELPQSASTATSMAPGLQSAFCEHEIMFYQGIAQSVGQIYHWITCRLTLLRVSLSALRWIHNHCPSVKKGEVYLVTAPPAPPPTGKTNTDPFLLHLMLSTAPSAPPMTKINQRVKKQDSPFKTYLFECVEMSEPFSTEIFGERHLVHPIRDNTGCAVALVDLTLTPIQMQSLDRGQLREITKVLNLLTTTFYYLSSSWEEPKFQLEGLMWAGFKHQLVETEELTSVDMDSDTDFNSLFNEMILEDLRRRISRIDSMVFAELRSYVDPPDLVFQVVKALHQILTPEKECDSWTQCKQMITVSMVRAMKEYNPLRVPNHPNLAAVKELISSIPVSAVYEHGSLPTKFIHLWIRACIPILEHSAASVTP